MKTHNPAIRETNDEASPPPRNRRQLRIGDTFPTLTLTDIAGEEITIPTEGNQLIHLQFRRFAGCPICNLHLRSITARLDDIAAAGVTEVVVFHATDAELRKYENDMPFAVVGDPDRILYRRFGVEASRWAILRPGAWRAIPQGAANMVGTAISRRRGLLPVKANGGLLGLPADVLIAPDGRVLAAKYGRHAYDQWSVQDLLTHARTAKV
jgi:peroxiredoxin